MYIHGKKKSAMSALKMNSFKIYLGKNGPIYRGKWLIHGTKHCAGNQSQSQKYPCKLSKLGIRTWYNGVPWQKVQSSILKEGLRTETSLCNYRYTMLLWWGWTAWNIMYTDILLFSVVVASYCYKLACSMFHNIITHAPVHINDFRGVRARYVKRTG